jgi:hypothetical protein
VVSDRFAGITDAQMVDVLRAVARMCLSSACSDPAVVTLCPSDQSPASEETLAALAKLEEDLDEQAFDALDEGDEVRHLRDFRQARALAAVRYAFGPDPLGSLDDVFNEATAVMDNLSSRLLLMTEAYVPHR